MDVSQLGLGSLIGVLLTTGWNYGTNLRRERREFHAAALLVRDEIRVNIVRLEIALQASEIPDGLQSDTYRDLQLVLARRLKAPELDAVRSAYVHQRVPRSMEERIMTWGAGGLAPEVVGTQPITEMVEAALAKASAAYDVLTKHVPRGSGEI